MKSSHDQPSKFILIARTILTKESVSKMIPVRNLVIERQQENSLMYLPLQTSFTSCFIVQPICYRRSPMFVGIVKIYRAQYACTLTNGFLNGEEIVHGDCSDQHRFSLPITSVWIPINIIGIDRCFSSLFFSRKQLFSLIMIVYRFLFSIVRLDTTNFSFKIRSHWTIGYEHCNSTS
jgi:hypothetical protein